MRLIAAYILTQATLAVAIKPFRSGVEPRNAQASLLIDGFGNPDANALGHWHGGDEGMKISYSNHEVVLHSTDADSNYYTGLFETCGDLSGRNADFLHISYSGHNKFSVSLQQATSDSNCETDAEPGIATWDSVQASRYSQNGKEIYIPISHFHINKQKTIAVAVRAFHSKHHVTLKKVEIVQSVPKDFKIPARLANTDLLFSCSRPDSFAFGIDDGEPKLAQRVKQILDNEKLRATFFTVGSGIVDPDTNFTNFYNEMIDEGHQIAYHSWSHPKMEGLDTQQEINDEYSKSSDAIGIALGVDSEYFRPPFGNEGARMRQAAAAYGIKHMVQWNIDVEDWLWGESATPEKQLDAFKRDVAKGGNLVVMHFLYNSTVELLPEFIRIARATGKQIMRIDQCMNDPNAPTFD